MELAPAPPWDDELIPASAADTGRAYADEHEDEIDNLRTPGSAAALVRPSLPVAQPAVSRTPPIAPALAKIPPATVPAPAAHVRITALGWDGDWPTLAAALPLRGVVLQLAQQSELLGSEQQGDATCLQLQVAIETLRASATVEKLALALSEHFSCTVRVETRLGPVHHSANLVLLAARAQRQRQAEQTMQADPFIQSLQREFGATIVPGSIKPISIN